MKHFIALYKKKLNLQQANFSYIDHEDAMVATVFKITQFHGPDLILKVCAQTRHYLREVHFLQHFAGKLPVPRILKLIEPENSVNGAILMEYLSGKLLTPEDLNDKLAYEIGSLLARIHLERTQGYGDLAQPDQLYSDPRIPFTMKFQEGLEECKGHLPEALLNDCKRLFNNDLNLLVSADGPCIVHRDFRPGNLIVNQGKVQGIIDWSSGQGGLAEEDLCPLEFGEWSDKSAYKNSFLEGYASLRKIPDYKPVMPLLRLSRAIASIGFMVRNKTWRSRHAKFYKSNRQFIDTMLKKSTSVP